MTELESSGELLRRIYEEEFGFIPINASMKPVHMANGLYRRLCGVTYDHRPLAGVMRQYVKNQRRRRGRGAPVQQRHSWPLPWCVHGCSRQPAVR